MGADAFDFAIVGSSPLALLLAGLLAARHQRKVCLVAQSHAAFRLPTGLDLSAAPLTRPETWALLAATVPETVRLLARVAGKLAYDRIDPLIVAETAAGRDALGHVRHVALGFGHAVEPEPASAALPDGAVANRFRDAVLINRPFLEAALMPWLESVGVRRLDTPDATAEFTVLADDEAALARGSRLLQPQPSLTLMTEPLPALPAPVMSFIDRGLAIRQLAGGGVSALVRGEGTNANGMAGAALGERARLAGQAPFLAAATPDGAPMLGLSEANVFTIAGLGMTGAFLAPAIARFLAGAATTQEAAWIDARSPLADRSLVGEVAS